MRPAIPSRSSRSILAVIGFFVGQSAVCAAQVYYTIENQRFAGAVATQTGLTLPPGTKDIFSFIEKQLSRTNCEVMDVKWTILPGQKGPLPAKEAEAMNLPQSFTYEGKPENLGYQPNCRVDVASIPFLGMIIFGITHGGEIRAIQTGGDSRRMIVECPELFGQKSTPQTKCGYFIVPETTVRVIMPRDSGIEQLVFFTRTYEDSEHWHLVRAGALDLPAYHPAVANGTPCAGRCLLHSIVAASLAKKTEKFQTGRFASCATW